MRYYLIDNTLIIKGNFHACSSGTGGGIRQVTSLINHTVSKKTASSDPDRIIDLIARKAGLSPSAAFGLLTSVQMKNLCVARYDGITLFVTAGITHPDPISFLSGYNTGDEQNPGGTINIICCIDEGMADQGLLDAVITVTEAKTVALRALGYHFVGTVTDAVIIAAERSGSSIRYAGSATILGRRIHESVVHAVSHALISGPGREKQQPEQQEPAFFIHSTIGGGRWVEWKKKGCPYYPCHFQGQLCDYCYCPLYPCHDESLGEWACRSSRKSRVWSCSSCSLNHQPAIVRHLKRNPQASLYELKALLMHQKDCLKPGFTR